MKLRKVTRMSIRRVVLVAVTFSLPVLLSLAGQSASAATPEDNESCTVNLDTGAVACSADGVGDRSAESAADGIKLVTIHENINYEGKKLTFTGTNGECSATRDGSDYGVSDLRDYKRGLFRNWNDAISSVVTYNHCDVRFFDDINYNGDYSKWIDASTNVGSWNDRASSFILS